MGLPLCRPAMLHNWVKTRCLRRESPYLFLVVFIGLYFRRKSAPLLIMIPVVFGALFSLAVVYFIKGSISVIAVGTGSVILGIAVNYSLHVFNHYRHTHSLERVIDDLAFPLTLGGVTTIGGFFCLNFAASDMLKDLGLFAGFSLIGASLVLVDLFATLYQKRQRKTGRAGNKPYMAGPACCFKTDHNKYLYSVDRSTDNDTGFLCRQGRF